MDLSDDSSRGSTSKSSRSSKSRNKSDKSVNSNSQSSKNKSQINVTPKQIEQFCSITGMLRKLINCMCSLWELIKKNVKNFIQEALMMQPVA